MPDLVNLLDHMKGKGVHCNGTTYPINEEGIARNVLDVDAGKLLKSRHWMLYDPEAASKREERRKAVREDFKRDRGGIQLIGNDGRVIDPKAEEAKAKAKAKAKAEAPSPTPTAEELPSMQPEAPAPEMPAPPAVLAADATTEMPAPPPVQPAAVPAPAPEPTPEPAAAPAPAEPEPSGEDEEEFPDPHMGMKKPQLQKIAKAYELQYTDRTSKKALVDMIMAAMYDQP